MITPAMLFVPPPLYRVPGNQPGSSGPSGPRSGSILDFARQLRHIEDDAEGKMERVIEVLRTMRQMVRDAQGLVGIRGAADTPAETTVNEGLVKCLEMLHDQSSWEATEMRATIRRMKLQDSIGRRNPRRLLLMLEALERRLVVALHRRGGHAAEAGSESIVVEAMIEKYRQYFEAIEQHTRELRLAPWLVPNLGPGRRPSNDICIKRRKNAWLTLRDIADHMNSALGNSNVPAPFSKYLGEIVPLLYAASQEVTRGEITGDSAAQRLLLRANVVARVAVWRIDIAEVISDLSMATDPRSAARHPVQAGDIRARLQALNGAERAHRDPVAWAELSGYILARLEYVPFEGRVLEDIMRKEVWARLIKNGLIALTGDCDNPNVPLLAT